MVEAPRAEQRDARAADARGVPAGAGERGPAARRGEVRQLDPDSIGSHVNRLYRAAYGLCGSRQDAEDLVQDTFERVLRRPRFLRHENDLVYLLRALRNTWISTRHKRSAPVVFASGETIDELEAPVDPIEQLISGDAVYEALRGLSEPLREAVVAVDVCGLSYKEAARALGTKDGTIMSRLHRGRAEIAGRLGSER